MLWVFLGELQWGSRYHGANEHATAREPLNYGTEEQLITTSVIWCGNKFSLKLSRETSTYRSVGGHQASAGGSASEYHSEGAVGASRLMDEPG